MILQIEDELSGVRYRASHARDAQDQEEQHPGNSCEGDGCDPFRMESLMIKFFSRF